MIKLPETIKWVITDFDGIITDNCLYVDDNGNMTRKINFKDIMAFSILSKNDFNIAIVSGEKNAAINILSEKFKINEVHVQIRNKIDVLKEIIKKYELTQEDYVYLGDDINDTLCLEYAKYKVTVPHAVEKVKSVQDIQITENNAGCGAFREVVDCLIG